VVGAEIEHFLSFANASNNGAANLSALEKQAHYAEGQWSCGSADHGERSIALEEIDVGIDIVGRGNGVKNEVEGIEMFLHLSAIGGDDDFMCAQAGSVGSFLGRCGEEHNVRTEGGGELHAHVAKAAKADHANLLTLAQIAAA